MNPLLGDGQGGNVLALTARGQTFFLGLMGGVQAAVTRCQPGAGLARGITNVVSASFDVLRPGAVVNLGVAFGANADGKQNLGDILLPSSVILYDANELQGESGYEFRGVKVEVSRAVQDAFDTARLGFKLDRPGGKRCSFHMGALLSGQTEFANAEKKRALLKHHRDVVGGDREVSLAIAIAIFIFNFA